MGNKQARAEAFMKADRAELAAKMLREEGRTNMAEMALRRAADLYAQAGFPHLRDVCIRKIAWLDDTWVEERRRKLRVKMLASKAKRALANKI